MPCACSEERVVEGDESPMSGKVQPRSFAFEVSLGRDRRCLKEAPWRVDLDDIRSTPSIVQLDASSVSIGTRPSSGDSVRFARASAIFIWLAWASLSSSSRLLGLDRRFRFSEYISPNSMNGSPATEEVDMGTGVLPRCPASVNLPSKALMVCSWTQSLE